MVMLFEDWIETYKPKTGTGGELIDHDVCDPALKEEIDKAIEEKRLWSLLEADGMMDITLGLHIVNREAVFITEIPCNDPKHEVIPFWTLKDEKERIADFLIDTNCKLPMEKLLKLSLEELITLERNHYSDG